MADYIELERLDDKLLAGVATTELMLRPGLLSFAGEIAGLIVVSFSSPMLKQVAVGAAI